MSTAMFDVAMSLRLRNAELQRLIGLAEDQFEVNEDAYNTLCRASCVLLASHLEGFLKDLSKSLIADLNFHMKSFAELPAAVKNTFCQRIAFYEGVKNDEINQRTKQLMAFFEKNSVAVDMQAFAYKENVNKNPGGDVIDSMLAKIGIPNVLWSLTGGRLESIFKNDPSTNYIVRRDIRRFRSTLHSFPYRKLPQRYGFKYKEEKGAKADKTIWHTFIADVMGRRHTIAHGDTMNNEVTTAQLRLDAERLDVLMHGLMYSAVHYIIKSL